MKHVGRNIDLSQMLWGHNRAEMEEEKQKAAL